MKSNKSSTLYNANSYVVSLAARYDASYRHLRLWMGAKYCEKCVCMSVSMTLCLIASHKKLSAELQQISCTCCLWLGSALITVLYIIYF